ncbi:hypothetical protein [Nonomuraea sp. NPDC050786]|uniref:hypothetical protein n=1 Tax=Nonomuraea sp. NPDC050786 TaxID=3154840 RepID=UPI0034008D8C
MRTQTRAIAEALRTETIGGVIMLTATIAALAWANLSPDSYEALRGTRLGPLWSWTSGRRTAC